MNWSHTTILHPNRMALGLSINEYTVLDWLYRTQTHPKFSKDGWTDISCRQMVQVLGVSLGGSSTICSRLQRRGFLEKHPEKTGFRRVTAKFYDIAYLPIESVQKVNAENGGVQKVNDLRSESERLRSESEQLSKEKERREVKKADSSVFPLRSKTEESGVSENFEEKKQDAFNETEANPERERKKNEAEKGANGVATLNKTAKKENATSDRRTLPQKMIAAYTDFRREHMDDEESFSPPGEDCRYMKRFAEKLLPWMEKKAMPLDDENVLRWLQKWMFNLRYEARPWLQHEGFTPYIWQKQFPALLKHLRDVWGGKVDRKAKAKAICDAATAMMDFDNL